MRRIWFINKTEILKNNLDNNIMIEIDVETNLKPLFLDEN
jgi:hypothetical protein